MAELEGAGTANAGVATITDGTEVVVLPSAPNGEGVEQSAAPVTSVREFESRDA